MRSATIHQTDTAALSAPIFAAARMAAPGRTRPDATSVASQMTGPRPARTSDVALTLPTSATMTANWAAGFQERVRAAFDTSSTIHGSAAHGPRITDKRAR